MPYVTVTVDFDMDELDTDDLVEELSRRILKDARKKLSTEQKSKLKKEYSALANALLFSPDNLIEVKSLQDKIKYEHLSNVFGKYSIDEIQTKLP